MLEEFAERRRRAMERMGDGVLIVFGAPVSLRNNDVEHDYRQDSDFYYLTGLDEPECVLVLTAGAQQPFVLFVRPRDPDRETWDGERVGVSGATQRFGADVAYPISELSARITDLLKGQRRLFYGLGRNLSKDQLVVSTLQRLRERVRAGESCPNEIIEPSTVLHEMRLVKSPGELELMRKAISITGEGHHAIMLSSHSNVAEYELEAILCERFRSAGSERCAYPPIVASGRNARVLHHRRNDRRSQDTELILVDAGAEYGYMAADITRTFPNNGRFTSLQRQAYEIVLRAQARAIEVVAPGATLDEVHQAAVREICSGLIGLGVLRGTLQESVESESYKKYYMHRTSHWLGMDVHDVGVYHFNGKARPLVQDMIITVEPGLYFDDEDPAVPEGLRNVGIRIEDDVRVTADGYEVLSASIIRTVDEIESFMASAPHRRAS